MNGNEAETGREKGGSESVRSRKRGARGSKRFRNRKALVPLLAASFGQAQG